MEQTAVKFLIKQIINDHNKKALTKSEWMKIFEKANKMFEQQIIDACYEGMQAQGFDPNKGRCKLYYDNKYGK